MKDRINEIADILLGAAYADDHLDGDEADTVRDLLCDVLDADELPAGLEKRIDDFSPDKFDLAATAAVFKDDAPESKRKLLELVVTINEADDELDMDEDEYLKNLASALGMPASAYKDLGLEVETVDLRADFESIRRG